MEKNIITLIAASALFLSLPPFCSCSQAQDTGVFEYKEIHLPEKETDLNRNLHLNNLDIDWGLWGHHVSNVLPKHPVDDVFAWNDGYRDSEQFCFTSDWLFSYLETYIKENFGEDKPQRFAILPNDNSLVCQCQHCKELGNTAQNASPAVFDMLRRIAQRFPKHLFFTSYYLTTRNTPDIDLPENTGVLVSAMDYPLCSATTAQEKDFEALLKTWKEKVKHVYVWDYINNFDDYFTPFPVFTIMQRRFQLYRRNGVSGIFLNGSGTEYSTFSRLKTYVLGQLLQDPDRDWRELVREGCRDYYPMTGDVIAGFIFEQETWTAEQARQLPLYGGMEEATKSYLPEKAFNRFYEQLTSLKPQTKGNEQKDIRMMCRALALTRLELQRLHGQLEDTPTLTASLKEMAEQGVKVYSEACWFIESYIKEYNEMKAHREQTRQKDLLLNARLTPLTALDPEYSDISILTDGLLGLPSNYHCGQMISSATPALRLAIPPTEGLKRLRISLTKNIIFHIDLPQQVILSDGHRELARNTPAPLPDNPNRSVVEFDIPANSSGTFILTFVRNQDERTMAIDEIEGY